MKTYQVLCKTCGGTGWIQTIESDNFSTSCGSEICPVCKGSKVQTINETS